jgi:hypothetical protein
VRLEAKDLNRTANSYDSGCAFLARQNKVMLSINGAAHVFIFSASLKREDEQKVTLALLI